MNDRIAAILNRNGTDGLELGYRQLRQLQHSFLAAGLAFLFYLLAAALLSSTGRLSLASINSVSSSGGQAVISHREGDDVSKLRIQDFHRLEIKDGRPSWEIQARDANYFHHQMTTHVNDASVTVYRPKQKAVVLHSDMARLNINGSSLLGAVLEGHVLVAIEDSLTAEAEHAEYQAASRVVSAPDKVKIHGNGYTVTGEGMEMQVDTENIRISKDVVSRFEPGAKAPSGVDLNPQEKVKR